MTNLATIEALQKILAFLKTSTDSLYAGQSIQELKCEVEALRDELTSSKPVDKKKLAHLIAPTGPLQDTAIDNGWGNEFMRIAEQLDSFGRTHP